MFVTSMLGLKALLRARRCMLNDLLSSPAHTQTKVLEVVLDSLRGLGNDSGEMMVCVSSLLL